MPETTDARIRRGFVDVGGLQVHYRTAGTASPGQLPLVMLHASPGSSKMLTQLMSAFAGARQVIAPDTLGNGDSDPPASPAPGLDVFVDAHIAAITRIAPGRFDLYGGHTGGNIAAEIAIRRADLVGRLILDGMSLYSADERADMLRNHAPPVTVTPDGAHLLWMWNFVRDAYLFWPWYRRDAAGRRDIGLPSADALHDKFVEVAKAARSYHLSYQAAIAYRKEERLPLVRVPTLVACGRTDMLLPYLDQVAALMPAARSVVTPGLSNAADLRDTVAIMEAFLA